MNILNTLKVLKYHPLTGSQRAHTFFRYFKYRLLHKFLKNPFVFSPVPFKNKVKFVIKDLEQYQIIYTDGLPEFYELSFLVHFIRPGDMFIDIGANRGLFSIIASGYCGVDSVAFEPVPGTFEDLAENVRLNDLNNRVRLINAGIGSQTTIAHFSTNHGSANSIVLETDPSRQNTIAVQVNRLDDMIPSIVSPTLIKIDVEGFEQEVLKGAIDTLQNQMVKAIIIELNGAAQKYNYNEADIHQHLLSLNFKPYRYYPLTRQLSLQDSYKSFINKKYMSDNTIYIRDYDFVAERIASSAKINTSTVSY